MLKRNNQCMKDTPPGHISFGHRSFVWTQDKSRSIQWKKRYNINGDSMAQSATFTQVVVGYLERAPATFLRWESLPFTTTQKMDNTQRLPTPMEVVFNIGYGDTTRIDRVPMVQSKPSRKRIHYIFKRPSQITI
jgi:hypothetical protein